jgi:hypothetical protein
MNKKYAFLPLVFLTGLFLVTSHAQNIVGSWSGTMRIEERFEGNGMKTTKMGLVTIVNNVATGTVTTTGEWYIAGKLVCKGTCSGRGAAQLWEVSFNKEESTYNVHAISPTFTCTNEGTYCEQNQGPMHPFDIVAYDQPLPTSNPNVLVGSVTHTGDVPGVGGGATTISWNLVRTIDVHLVVIPQDYDNWMPEPGRDEITKGNVLHLSLKLQKGNGQAPEVKAKSFELELENTSSEPGITLNAPLVPRIDLPDLRFQIEQPNSQLDNNFQFLRINCNGCSQAAASIASFDGGGYTTLKVKAILEDNSEVIGSLHVANGIREIPIPKRESTSNIAARWRVANNVANDDEDIEESNGNTNNGDGLSAYEEYRGVIAEGVFKRLDPRKKELGVRMKRAEFALFTTGIRLLENEADIKVIRFHENEIGNDRRLNKNSATSNIYEQNALKLEKVRLPEGVMGACEPIEVSPKIPKLATRVSVDVDQMMQIEAHYIAIGSAGPSSLQDEIAATTAHELGHALGISHHGPGGHVGIERVFSRTDVVLSPRGDSIRFRPYELGKKCVGKKGSVQSGDLSCFMAYNQYYRWAANEKPNQLIFAEVPPIPIGKNYVRMLMERV